MKTKIIILFITLIISIGVNIFQYFELKKAKLELNNSDEALTLCDNDIKEKEKQLGYAYQLINEYDILFPNSFLKSMAIDNSKIEELRNKIR